ncbi:contactin-4-like [Chelonus insularis]|uniref:contactin-4-like n=1 Tax=Chelonus insularis TaxID=460826 RepID=UPI00158A76FE|nr:contactin-4-like [Chelonus insularis]
MAFIPLSIAVLFISSACGFRSFGLDSELGGLGPHSVPISDADRTKIDKNVTTHIIANPGDSVQFECYATGNPTPTIRWTRYFNPPDPLLPNGEKEYNGNILKIPSANSQTAGDYICEAENMNSDDFLHYSLEIASEPIITEVSQTHVFGSYILLQCTASCHPRTTFQWYKNGELLTMKEDDPANDQFVPIGIVLGSFGFSTKDNDFEGTYKCVIENHLGKDEKVFEINGSAIATPK